MSPEVIASIIAASTALVAVVIGPFLTIRAAKTQMLGPMRQAWINSLRDTVSEFSASIHAGQLQTTVHALANNELSHATHVSNHGHLQNTYQMKEKIWLLINPKEAEHLELARLAECAYEAYASSLDTTIPLHTLRKYTQKVLKKEWDVVKK